MSNLFDMEIQTDLTYGRGYVYSLQYHIVWCTKYRQKILQAGVDEALKKYLYRLSDEYKFTITAMEVMPDRVHLLVDCSPQFEIPKMMRVLKGTSARWLFMERPELKKELCGGHLWNPSYCIVMASDRSKEQVEKYLASQKERADMI